MCKWFARIMQDRRLAAHACKGLLKAKIKGGVSFWFARCDLPDDFAYLGPGFGGSLADYEPIRISGVCTRAIAAHMAYVCTWRSSTAVIPAPGSARLSHEPMTLRLSTDCLERWAPTTTVDGLAACVSSLNPIPPADPRRREGRRPKSNRRGRDKDRKFGSPAASSR
jgi:hypothetical protein